MERAFVIIKPDAIERKLIGRIISRLEDKNLCITNIKMDQKNIAWCKLMWPHLAKIPEIFETLCTFMTRQPLIGMVFEGEYAIKIVRNIVGTTDSCQACPGTIRGDYGGSPTRYNCVHCADSVINAEKEIKLFFGTN